MLFLYVLYHGQCIIAYIKLSSWWPFLAYRTVDDVCNASMTLNFCVVAASRSNNTKCHRCCERIA